MITSEDVRRVMALADKFNLRANEPGEDGLVARTCRACGASTGRDTVAAQFAREPHGCPACSVAEAAA